MICTSVTPCLSAGLAKNDKIMSTFVLFSGLLAILKVWLFPKTGGGGGGGGGQTLHQSSQMGCF